LLLKNPTPEKIAEIRARLALDRPLPMQYVIWMKNLLAHGNLGESVVTGRNIRDDLVRTWPATMELALAAMFLATAAGVWLGLFCARNPGTWKDALGTAASLVGLSVPVFWLGLLAILLFSLQLGWFPAGDRLSMVPTIAPWLDQLHHLALPALVLATIPAAFVARVTRAAVWETLGQDFIRTARAKGVPERTVILKHMLRNSLIPMVMIFGGILPGMISGSVIIENMFSIPGLGQLGFQAVLARDYPVVLALFASSSGLALLGFLVSDVLLALVDPRISFSRVTA
jgi:ABC-type dipeptide/oligopeptide/nickel transport system permease component